MYRETEKKITYQTVMDALNSRQVVVSLVMMGWPAMIPKQFTKVIAIHGTMMQNTATGGEAFWSSMQTVIKATTNGTD